MFKNVLVGVDRRPGGRDALALARQLVAPDGRLTLAYVYPGDARLWRDSTLTYRESALAYQRIEQERALKLLAQVRDEGEVGAELRCTEAASPGHGLHALAEAIGADLLVVGSCHHGRLGRALLGDDTRAALSGAPCPVAIAPPGYAEQARPGNTQNDSGKGTRCPDMTLTS